MPNHRSWIWSDFPSKITAAGAPLLKYDNSRQQQLQTKVKIERAGRLGAHLQYRPFHANRKACTGLKDGRSLTRFISGRNSALVSGPGVSAAHCFISVQCTHSQDSHLSGSKSFP